MIQQHLPLLPVIVPLVMGALLLLPPFGNSLTWQRNLSILTSGVLIGLGIWMLDVAGQGSLLLYHLGDWRPPFGIMFMLDRTAALLILLSGVLTLGVLLYATGGEDKTGRHFYPLILFLITGVNGAFLTGDLFNLFVFFEILLIASYSLLIHGGGRYRTQAAMHYVVLNLVGSSFFLLALGTLYGTLGTLSMADMAAKVPLLSSDQQSLAKAGGLMLLVVFGLKSALLPLQFWLPRTYAVASAPVAALFAIMTKVGIYSIYRVFTLIFGPEAGDLANIAQPWLWPLSLLTLAAGALGALASHSLRRLAANLVIISVGTLLLAAAMATPQALGAALYYLIHSTLIAAALFLLADAIAEQRHPGDRFIPTYQVQQPVLLGSAFFIVSLSLIGMPPFSGFVGKVLLLQAAPTAAMAAWVWPALLISSLVVIICLSRAGSKIFWQVQGKNSATQPAPIFKLSGVWLLLLCSPLMVIFAGSLSNYTYLAAEQLFDIQATLQQILSSGDQ